MRARQRQARRAENDGAEIRHIDNLLAGQRPRLKIDALDRVVGQEADMVAGQLDILGVGLVLVADQVPCRHGMMIAVADQQELLFRKPALQF